MHTGFQKKYRPIKPLNLPDRQWPERSITKAPLWCSVDLRDGNQALPVPMNVAEKLELFALLTGIGFKEIEVGFPAAAETEYHFTRRIIEAQLIPQDVRIQVLTQARESLIQKTFESLQGVPRATIHLYNSTSTLQRKITFGNATREQIKQIAVDGATLCQQLLPTLAGSDIRFQYSPESFSDTEPDFALEVCEAVLDIWQPTPERPVILNLPATVEYSTPNCYADYIEWFSRHITRRDSVLISLHTHNDRGTGIAATELGILAGADRVEGTLFGNGERTGNVDIVTVALNMFAQGVDPQLDLREIPNLREVYERTTRMSVPERWPYAGELVFTAFSGSHQDAIKKGMDRRGPSASPDSPWEVPYLHIDPRDIGRTYEAIIRINSQSGKGGVAYVLAHDHGLDLPKTMHPAVGKRIYNEADKLGKELSSEEILEIFLREFVNNQHLLRLEDYTILHLPEHEIRCDARVLYKGQQQDISGMGNGPINAFVHAIENAGWKDFNVTDYRSHAIGKGSATESAAYIQIRTSREELVWGCGIDTNIEAAGLHALVSACNLSWK